MRRTLMVLLFSALIASMAAPASAETIPIEQLVHLKILEGRELGFYEKQYTDIVVEVVHLPAAEDPTNPVVVQVPTVNVFNVYGLESDPEGACAGYGWTDGTNPYSTFVVNCSSYPITLYVITGKPAEVGWST
jgi:hypothetical protein